MESQDQPISPNLQPTAEPGKKCKHTPIIIILAILAIGGLGFGVFEFWQNIQKNDEINTLQINNNLNQQLQQISEKDEENSKNEKNNENLNSVQDYIYIGKWGIKLKLPDNVKNVGYKYSDYSSTFSGIDTDDYSVLEIFGISKDTEVSSSVIDEYIYLMRNNGCYNVSISRIKSDSAGGGYKYSVNGPQATCTGDEQLLKIEAQATPIFTAYYRENLESLIYSF